MNGVTFLKTYEEVASTTWGWNWIGLFVGLIALVLLAFAVYFSVKDKDVGCFGAGLLCAALAGLVSVLCFATGTEVYETRHDVYLSGEINMTEFTEKYRVVKQDGLVFTIIDVDTIEGE